MGVTINISVNAENGEFAARDLLDFFHVMRRAVTSSASATPFEYASGTFDGEDPEGFVGVIEGVQQTTEVNNQAADRTVDPKEARQAEATLLKEATTGTRRRGRISNAEKAQLQVAAAQANPPPAEDNSMQLHELLSADPEPTGTQVDAPVEAATEADVAAAEETIKASEPTSKVSDPGFDFDAMLGTVEPTAPAAPAEDYKSWDKAKLFGEAKKRATSKWGLNDAKDPMGTMWVRDFVTKVNSGSLGSATEDELRMLLIRTDAGLAP